MGYLSQKKHESRENIFLTILAFVLVITTGIYLLLNGVYFDFFNIFHVYCLSLLFALYTIFIKKYKFTLIFGLILVFSYIILGTSANIFFTKSFNGKQNLKLTFSENVSLKQNFNSDDVVSAGALIVANKYISPYVNVKQDETLTFIKVDFKNVLQTEYNLIFKHLKDFIFNQSNPVVVFGEFGLPVWDKRFITFLRETNLKVKNKLIFTGTSVYRFIKTPSFYLLGFDEMGINELSIKDNNKTIEMVISFNLENF